MTSPIEKEPPSTAKLMLIRAFLRVTGLQAAIDDGEILAAYASPGGPLWTAAFEAAQAGNLTYGRFMSLPTEALRAAYQKHRTVWQAEYEAQVDGEFTEDELRQILAFFESAPGRRYLDAAPRMKTYAATNTEDLTEQIIREAIALLPQLANEPEKPPP